jgi:hypothetical protein
MLEVPVELFENMFLNLEKLDLLLKVFIDAITATALFIVALAAAIVFSHLMNPNGDNGNNGDNKDKDKPAPKLDPVIRIRPKISKEFQEEINKILSDMRKKAYRFMKI